MAKQTTRGLTILFTFDGLQARAEGLASHIMEKPFSVAELIDKVTKLLD